MHVHHHHNEEHSAHERSIGSAFVFSIVLNAVFVAIEFTCGYFFDSLALVADAWHNLGDVASLGISLFAFSMAAKKPSSIYTFGYSKGTVLASLASCVLLFIAVGTIGKEAINSLAEPNKPHGKVIWMVAAIGILINALTALQFYKKNELNSKAAFVHLLADALVSVGVLITGIIIQFTGWYYLDGIVSMIIALVILLSSWKLLRYSLRLSLDGVPENVEPDKIVAAIQSVPGVKEVNHIHIWALSTTRNALTAHILLQHQSIDSVGIESIKQQVREQLQTLNIDHATLETELIKKEDCTNLPSSSEHEHSGHTHD